MAAPEGSLTRLMNQYKKALGALAGSEKRRGSKLIAVTDLSNIWEDEDSDVWQFLDEGDLVFSEPLDEEDLTVELRSNIDIEKRAHLLQKMTDYLQSLLYVVVPLNAYRIFQRMARDVSEKVNNHYGGSTSLSWQLQPVFEAELMFAAGMTRKRRYDLAVNSLIATLLTWRYEPIGFLDYENDIAPIINLFGKLWRTLMGSDLLKNFNDLLSSGYVREFAKASEIEIPREINALIQEWTILVDDRSKRVLYDLMDKINEECVYYVDESTGDESGIPFGDIPSNIKDLRQKRIRIENASEDESEPETESAAKCSWSKEQLEENTTDQLRKICKKIEECPIDIVDTDRDELMEYLLDPEAYLWKMKIHHHYAQDQDPPIYIPDGGMTEKEMLCVRLLQFSPERYVVRNGVVYERMAYVWEMRGETTPEILRGM